MTPNSTVETCPVCKGEGVIWSVENGYDTVRDCSCQIPVRIEKYLKISGIDAAEYAAKSLDSFRTDTTEAAAMKLMAEKFLADQTAAGIGYFGKSGTGKTHICIAVCGELTRRRLVPHLYFSYRREIQKLKAVFFEQEEYGRLMRQWTECRVLYIDDFLKFAVDRSGKPQIQDLQIIFDLINTRYLNRTITIFSSEQTLQEIKEIDAALASRIYEMISPYRMKCSGANRRFMEK